MGNSGARSSGPSGLSVPGCSGGARGLGRSGRMLYQACGMWFCGRLYWIVSMRNILQGALWRPTCSISRLSALAESRLRSLCD